MAVTISPATDASAAYCRDCCAAWHWLAACGSLGNCKLDRQGSRISA